LRLYSAAISNPAELDAVFEQAVATGAEALFSIPDPNFSSYRANIAELAARAKLPAGYFDRANVEQGGLMSYGPNAAAAYRRAGAYVDKILRGARPGDLPFEQPSTFEFVVNVKAAEALGLRIPLE